jgi:hypothetical protein
MITRIRERIADARKTMRLHTEFSREHPQRGHVIQRISTEEFYGWTCLTCSDEEGRQIALVTSRRRARR